MGNKGNRTALQTYLLIDKAISRYTWRAHPVRHDQRGLFHQKTTPDMGEPKFPNDREGAPFPFLFEKRVRPYRANLFTPYRGMIFAGLDFQGIRVYRSDEGGWVVVVGAHPAFAAATLQLAIFATSA